MAQQGYTSKTLPYKRGDILDRNGNVLATSVKVYNLVIDSKVILSNKKYLEPTVNVLTRYFDLNKDELTKGIKERKDNSYWVVLKQLEYKDIEGYKDYINKEEPSKEEAKEISYVKGGQEDCRRLMKKKMSVLSRRGSAEERQCLKIRSGRDGEAQNLFHSVIFFLF